MVKYVRDLSPAEKLEIYKRIKGVCYNEGLTGMAFISTMRHALNEKVQDLGLDEMEFEYPVTFMDCYIDYSYGRY